MIDDDDVSDFALFFPVVGTITAIIFIIGIIGLTYISCVNEKECNQKTCNGDIKPMLIKGECLCVEKAK